SRSAKRYSARAAMRAASCSTASAARSPEADSSSSVPPVAPRPRTCRMLFAFARLPFAATSTEHGNDDASLTNWPAGRACRATCAGRRAATTTSELANISRLPGRGCDGLKVGPGRSRHACRDGTFDERRVCDLDPRQLLRRQLAERRADGENRAPEIHQHDGSGAVLVRGGPQDVEHLAAVRSAR